MRCDVCGNESDFDAAFVKERKSLRFSRRTLCPACWVRRSHKHESRFLVGMLAGGVIGYVLEQILPGTFIGQFLLTLSLIGIFLVVSVIPHELGHVIAGRALGWRVYQVVIGIGKALFKRRWFGILFDVRAIPVAGVTLTIPTDMRWYRAKRFLIVLAGPAVNVAMAIAAIIAWHGGLSNFEFQSLPEPVRLFVLANVFVALINLWPHQPKTGFALPSDGKQLLQILSFRKTDVEATQAMRFALEAMMCRERGDLAGARSWCDKGLALYPQDPHLLNLSGVNHIDEQNYAQAREVFLKLLAKENQPAGMRFLFLNNLAYTDVLSENPAWISEADAYSKDAYTGLPWSSATVGTRGTVLVAMGNYEEGMKLLKKSMDDAESPRNRAENSCHMAIALAKSGNCGEAQKYLELARQLDAQCTILARAEREINVARQKPSLSETLAVEN